MAAFTRNALKIGTQALARAAQPAAARRARTGTGSWTKGVAIGAAGARRFHLYRPPDLTFGERLPLMVMLHGCGQDASAFAGSTHMQRIANSKRFLVLYPEQDRMANPQGCWNWFDTSSGRAFGEAALIMNAIDQVCLLHPADRARVAVAGFSAGASMAALLVTRYPARFRAVVMHSGIPPGAAHSTLSALGAMRGRRPARALAASPQSMAAAWPPLLVIHGSGDPLVSPHNGGAAARLWADAARAQAGPARSVRYGQRHAMSITDFKAGGRLVSTLVEVKGLAHAWSGGTGTAPNSDPRGPDASRMAWGFAAKQFSA